MESSDSVALNETYLQDQNLTANQAGTSCDSVQVCNACSIRKTRTETSCDSIEFCEDCAAKNVLSRKPSRRNTTDTQSTMTVCSKCQISFRPGVQSSCGSVDICDDCGKINRPSSRQSSPEASCESMAVCSKCQVSFQRPQTSCESVDVCEKCAMPGKIPSRAIIEASCDSVNVCRECESILKSGPETSCDSINICEACAKKNLSLSRKASRMETTETSCDSMATCSKCYLSFQRPQTSRDSIDVCSQCAMRPATANIPSKTRLPVTSCDSVNVCRRCSSIMKVRPQTSTGSSDNRYWSRYDYPSTEDTSRWETTETSPLRAYSSCYWPLQRETQKSNKSIYACSSCGTRIGQGTGLYGSLSRPCVGPTCRQSDSPKTYKVSGTFQLTAVEASTNL